MATAVQKHSPAFLAVSALLLLASAGFAQEPSRPSFAEIERAIRLRFTSDPHFDSAGLFTKEQAATALETAAKMGWQVPKAEELLLLTLPAGDSLVTLLNSPRGREFLKQGGSYALLYDRLDRLARMPGGQQLIGTMLTKPNGHLLMQPLPAGDLRSPTRLLPRGRSGKTQSDQDFNKPTGRIYTLDQFLGKLQTVYRGS